MQQDFLTISNSITCTETVINRSRFLGYAVGVGSDKEATEFIKSISKQHYDATHNCYAYHLGDYSRYSDDGEPQGTAGLPILECIKKSRLIDLCVVVTRYFGGVKLGAGGLVRAYSQSASLALAQSSKIEVLSCVRLFVTLPYNVNKAVGAKICALCCQANTQYSDTVTIECAVRQSEIAQFISRVTDMTSGKAVITTGDEVLIRRNA